MRKVRTLRHWKQQYDKNAKFVWRRGGVYAGVPHEIGDDIPETLFKNKTKLRRFWDSGWIELAEFEDAGLIPRNELDLDLPQGIEIPDDVQVTKGNGSWFHVTVDGKDGKFNGKKALADFIVTLVEGRANAQAPSDDEG